MQPAGLRADEGIPCISLPASVRLPRPARCPARWRLPILPAGRSSDDSILDLSWLRDLLAGVVDVSQARTEEREAELTRARVERTRLNTAIKILLILVEQGVMGPRDPAFAERMAENRTALAGVSSRIEVLEAQLAKGKRQIDEQTIDRFGEMLRGKIRGGDSSLRSAYLKMFVTEVRVSDEEIIISGPVPALENGVAVGLPVKEGAVPIFDREWCPEEDSNLHDLAIAST